MSLFSRQNTPDTKAEVEPTYLTTHKHKEAQANTEQTEREREEKPSSQAQTPDYSARQSAQALILKTAAWLTGWVSISLFLCAIWSMALEKADGNAEIKKK